MPKTELVHLKVLFTISTEQFMLFEKILNGIMKEKDLHVHYDLCAEKLDLLETTVQQHKMLFQVNEHSMCHFGNIQPDLREHLSRSRPLVSMIV